jgi:hypothetical protein
VTAAWREYQRGTALINRAKDHGRAHPGATDEDTLTALAEPATENNWLYARAGLFLAARDREDAARGGLTQALLGEGGKPEEDTMKGIDPGTLTWLKRGGSSNDG